MAIASAAAAVAPLSSSLFLRRTSAAVASRSYLYCPPRASWSSRVAGLVVPFPLPSLRRPKSRFATAASDDFDSMDVELEVGSGDGDGFEESDQGAGGGGDRRGGDGEGVGGGGNFDDDEGEPEKKEVEDVASGMSMSQKLTLGYAVLVGVGGIMGYVKGGSQKSLAAGGTAALLLYYVYTQLPVRPAFASSVGLGLSAALLAVMGSRFKSSGKIFPAGVVSLVSLVMTGGYLHGILRSSHV